MHMAGCDSKMEGMTQKILAEWSKWNNQAVKGDSKKWKTTKSGRSKKR